MRTVTAPLVVRRVGSARLVVAALLLIMITVATLAAALADLAGRALAQSAVRKLVGAAGTSLTIEGPLGEGAARADTAVIRSALRATFGAVPVTLYRSAWSQSLGLPAARGAAQVPLLAAAAPDAISAKAALIRGTWPGSPSAGRPVPAAIPSAVADRLRLAVGDVLTVHDRDRGTDVRLRIAGVYRPRKPGEAYWNLDLIGTAGVNTVGAFVTYGPAVVDQAAFSRGYLPVDYSSWLALPQTARIGTGQLRALAARVSRLESALRQSPRLGGLQVITKLPDVLNGIATNLTVARALLAIGALQSLLVAGATVLLATSLLAGQRGGESALFRARGGSRWQLARLNAAEVLPAACIAAIGGALLGSRLAALLSETGPLHNVQMRLSGTPASVWWAATAAAVVCAVPPLALAVHRLAPGEERVRRGRQAAVAGIVRASGDLALAALAALAVWQLQRYVPGGRAIGGGIGGAPVLAAAPVLALAGGTVVLMRLLAPAAWGGDRLASQGKRLLTVLATWEFSRRPVRHGGPALLGVLAVATGTLVLAQLASSQRSARDQAAFAVGADLRLNTAAPVPLSRVADVAGHQGAPAAMPVARVTSESTGVLLAVGARTAPAAVLLRPDLSRLPPALLWKRIIANTADGIAVPGRPARLEISASLGPPGIPLGHVRVIASVQDATGVAYVVPFGTLAADGRRHALTASISRARRAAYPLRLLAISLTYTMPPAKTGAAELTVSSAAAAEAASGPFRAPFARGSALRGWSPTVSAPALAAEERNLGSINGHPPAMSRWLPTASGGQSLSFHPGHALLPAFGAPTEPPSRLPAQLAMTARRPGTPDVPPIPGVATQAYLDSTKTAVGAIVPAVVNDVTVPVRITARVAAFPTVTGRGGALIVDQSTVQDILAAQLADPLPVTEWWLPARHAPPRLPTGAVLTSRAAVAAGLLGDPLSGVPRQALLAVALAAAVLAAAGFTVSVAASAAERRPQDALLAALGLSRWARARLLCLESLMLSVPAAAAGLGLGAALARLLIPASTLTPYATAPVPPVITEVPLARAAALATVVAAVPVLAAATVATRRRDPAAHLRAAEPG